MNQQRRVSSKLKQKQLETKFLQEQTKKMEQKLSELKKQVEEQRQLKATTYVFQQQNNFESTVTRWKKTTRSDAPLKSYAKQILQEQKQAYKKFGIDQKKITGTKTFSSIKKRLKQEKQDEEDRNPTKIPSLMSKTSNSANRNNQNKEQPLQKTELPVETIQNNFFKAKIDVKNLVKEKTIIQFLEEIFLQQYNPQFLENNVTQLGDLRFLTLQQLHQMGIPKGHQIKIMKRIREEFDKSKSPSKVPFLLKNEDDQEQEKRVEQKPVEKIVVEMGYGDGNVNDYAQIEAQENHLKDLEQNFDEVDSENMSEGEQNDVVLITVPLSEIALQTGNQAYDQAQISNQSMAENCFNCYRLIPLKNQLFQSPDNRNFCSFNCLKIYKLQMQKSCPACGRQFFKTNGYYEEGMWFCSIGCCPNKDQIEEMFLEWTQQHKR